MTVINIALATIVLWAGLTIMGIPSKPRILITTTATLILYFNNITGG